VRRFAKVQLALDSTREHFHIDPQWVRAKRCWSGRTISVS